MANSKATRFMVMAAFLSILLLISTEEVASAVAYGSLPEFILGRKVLSAEYEPTGRGGYNSYKPTGRGAYNSYGTTGRGGYN